MNGLNGFQKFLRLCVWQNVASALEGLRVKEVILYDSYRYLTL